MNSLIRLVPFATVLLVPSLVLADTATQTLPHTQSWTVITQIATNDDWSGVPGWIGYRGDDLTGASGVDPQTVLSEGTPVVDVNANQTSPDTFGTGGVAEFHITDPVVALQGSGTADAPNLVVGFDTTDLTAVRVQYDLRDIDGSAANTIQPVALQYRVGNTGDFTNIGQAFVADASSGPSLATLVTSIDIMLPAAALDQPRVELRWITTDAVGAAGDEWIGIDNVSITASTAPAATGNATPATLAAGDPTTLTATVTPGTNPVSTGVAVVCDLTSIGGIAAQPLFDDASNGDLVAADGTFTFATTVAAAIDGGIKTLGCVVSDAQTRSSVFTITLTVNPVCGNGNVEGTEACDDDDNDPGDGCSAACTVEPGWTCTGDPSTCTDIDECADMTDTCNENATCTNQSPGFSCACNTGYTGDGMTCTEVDECGLNTDDCVANATCSNTPPGSFTCTCPAGYGGDGHAGGTGCTEINECTAGTDTCDANAACTNTDGSFTCMCNAGFTGDGMTCTPVCGDAMVVPGETCDDDGTEGDDGCSATCQTEPGWDCAGMPSVCTEDCGDGLVVGGEECDDAGTTDGDGCDATCVEEPGWMCTGEPSTCSEEALCGDGAVDPGEECDDGNDAGDDGCDATCEEETGWVCDDAEPSECVEDGDGDLIADDDDNCPDVANPSQADEDDDDIGDACDDPQPPGDTGCCSTSSDPRNVAGFGLLALLTVIALRRKRR